MPKWLILAAGVFLFFNGMMSRTYSYTSEPVKHCFNMDYIRVFGCFSYPVVPHLITWGRSRESELIPKQPAVETLNSVTHREVFGVGRST